MQIEFREYQKQDFQVLENIIRETWHYDEFSSPKTAAKLARVFLSSCLTNQTFSCVALLNDKPIGVILLKNKSKHKCPLKYRLKQIKSILSLYLSREGRNVSKIFGSVNGIDKELLAGIEKDYPAELALFAVDTTSREKGVGRALFQYALEYLKEQGLKEFYLFTDTSCNYKFYEHQGMSRQNEKEHSFTINGSEAIMHFFIYEMQSDKY